MIRLLMLCLLIISCGTEQTYKTNNDYNYEPDNTNIENCLDTYKKFKKELCNNYALNEHCSINPSVVYNFILDNYKELGCQN